MLNKLLSEPGSTVLLLGNEAIARGAIEGGVGFASAYPGTPSTEIIESLASVAKELGIYVEWSANEKIALEAAYAASLSGVRALAAMKHVGLNVASDAFMSIAYTGVRAGLLIISAEDPNMWSSQNEQDNRYYGLMAKVPVFEPYNPQEAKDMTIYALDFSERFEHPVLMTPTTRVSHTRGPVKFGKPRVPIRKGYFKRDIERFTLIPSHARARRHVLVRKWEEIKEELSKVPFNRLEGEEGDTLVVASGISYAYAKEVLKLLNIKGIKLLKLGTPVPIPRELVKRSLEDVKKVLVIEELEDVVEMQIKALINEEGLDVKVHGKDYVGYEGEMTLERAFHAITEFLGVKVSPPWISKITEIPNLPPRPPAMCPGCPHRATFYVLRRAVNSLSIKPVYSGDIGCYSLGALPPFMEQDIILEMGGSIGTANGFGQVLEKQVPIAIIGDSTFFHAGLPGLVNAVYNRSPILVLVMDNRVTAMTGEQPNPGTGLNALGEPAPAIKIEEIAKGIGVEKVVVFDPYNTKEAFKALREALEYVIKERKPAVAVAKRACALIVDRMARRKGIRPPRYQVRLEACTACGVCYNAFTCPAIAVRDDGKAYILEDLCTGCGVCAQICPFKAIEKVEEGDKEWEKLWF
jgi:indolepyruvate ferredoxin oxidoreductase alpha subunit